MLYLELSLNNNSGALSTSEKANFFPTNSKDSLFDFSTDDAATTSGFISIKIG